MILATNTKTALIVGGILSALCLLDHFHLLLALTVATLTVIVAAYLEAKSVL